VRSILVIGAGAAVVFLAACGHTATVPAKQLGDLVLHPGDLPAQFTAFYVGPQVRLDTAGTPRANPARFGRKGGWIARYHRPGTFGTRGPLVLDSGVDVFGDADGAKQDLSAYRALFAETAASGGPGAKAISVPRIGDEAIGMTNRQIGPHPVRFFVIAWRFRNATAAVGANGFEGKVTVAGVVRLARRQQQRLASD